MRAPTVRADVVNDPEIRKLPERDRLIYFTLVFLKALGKLDRPYPTAELRLEVVSEGLRLDGVDTLPALERLIQYGVIDEDWNPYSQAYEPSGSAERTRRWRKRQSPGDVTLGDASHVTLDVTPPCDASHVTEDVTPGSDLRAVFYSSASDSESVEDGIQEESEPTASPSVANYEKAGASGANVAVTPGDASHVTPDVTPPCDASDVTPPVTQDVTPVEVTPPAKRGAGDTRIRFRRKDDPDGPIDAGGFEALPIVGDEEAVLSFPHVDELVRLHPGVDVKREVAKMRSWLLANPKKRKTRTGILTFVSSWLGREQNRPRDGSQPHSPQLHRQSRADAEYFAQFGQKGVA